MVNVQTHPTWRRLERALWANLATIKENDPLTPVIVLTPTASLSHYLRVRAAERFEALLHVLFANYSALEFLIFETAMESGLLPTLPRKMAELLEEAEVQSVLAQVPAGQLRAYVSVLPAARRALQESFRDLRHCGLSGAVVDDLERTWRKTPLARETAEFLAIYRHYENRLRELGAQGLLDDAGWTMECCRLLSEVSWPYTHVLHYGAYDLIGSRQRLLEKLAGCTDLCVLAPWHAEAVPFEYARQSLTRSFGVSQVISLEGEDKRDRDIESCLLRLNGGSSAVLEPARVPEGFCTIVSAQGLESELTYIARNILHLYGTGTPLEEIGVVIRSLEPYAATLHAVFRRHQIPIHSVAAMMLLNEPRARAFRDLVLVLSGRFERQAVMNLLTSGFFRFEAILPKYPRPRVEIWDRWVRRAGIVDGYADWQRRLEALSETISGPQSSDPEVPERSSQQGRGTRREKSSPAGFSTEQGPILLSVLKHLKQRSDQWNDASTWSAKALLLRSTAARLLDGFLEEETRGFPEVNAVGELLASMAMLDGVAPDGGFPDASAAEDWLTESLQTCRLRDSTSGRGVRVLDYMQARGHCFRVLFLAGFNAQLFPRKPTPDPFLNDTLRQAIATETRLPLRLKSAGLSEENLLLALLLGSVEEKLYVTYQRADAQGEVLLPSPALRDISRFLGGDGDSGELLATATHVPLHPAKLEEFYLQHSGVVSPSGALVAAAIHDPDRLREPGYQVPSLGTYGDHFLEGLGVLTILESSSTQQLEFDGQMEVPPSDLPVLSPSSLDALGRCPLSYFFSHLLRIWEVEEPLPQDALDSRELGLCSHQLMKGVYEDLKVRGVLGDPQLARTDIETLAETILEKHWREAWAAPRHRIGDRLPLLWRVTEREWRTALKEFIVGDLVRLQEMGAMDLEVERVMAGEILPRNEKGHALRVEGRADRTVRLRRDVVWVGDYKSGNLSKERMTNTEILRGNALQLAAYLLLAEGVDEFEGAAIHGHLLGIGPRHADASAEDKCVTWKLPPRNEPLRAGLEETLDILNRFRRLGAFPFHPREHCMFCHYRRACRRNHGPSRQRVEGAGRFKAYFELKNKSVRNRFFVEDK